MKENMIKRNTRKQRRMNRVKENGIKQHTDKKVKEWKKENLIKKKVTHKIRKEIKDGNNAPTQHKFRHLVPPRPPRTAPPPPRTSFQRPLVNCSTAPPPPLSRTSLQQTLEHPLTGLFPPPPPWSCYTAIPPHSLPIFSTLTPTQPSDFPSATCNSRNLSTTPRIFINSSASTHSSS